MDRHGVRPRPFVTTSTGYGRTAAGAPSGGDWTWRPGRVTGRTPSRCAAPGCQAGQRVARRRRPGGADRLRAGDRPWRPGGHPDRTGARLTGVPGSGAGSGRQRWSRGRYVVARCHALRRGGRALAVRPALRDRHARRAGHGAAGAGEAGRRPAPRPQWPAAEEAVRADPAGGGGAVAVAGRGARVAHATWPGAIPGSTPAPAAGCGHLRRCGGCRSRRGWAEHSRAAEERRSDRRDTGGTDPTGPDAAGKHPGRRSAGCHQPARSGPGGREPAGQGRGRRGCRG